MLKSNDAIIIIPARYDSSRFPGKPLALVNGYTMIERVWRIACCCQKANGVYIATDSEKIASHVSGFGANVLMTSPSCPTGTDRVAEAAAQLVTDDTIVISFQGDAVLTPPWIIDDIIEALRDNFQAGVATPAVKLFGTTLTDFLNHKKVSPSSGTTVTFDKNGMALYFSKQPIPYLYNNDLPNATLYRHIGLYGYRFKTLKLLQALPQSPLEKQEKLEQLRALENGIPIKVITVDYKGRSHGSIDTVQDVKVVERIIAEEGELIS